MIPDSPERSQPTGGGLSLPKAAAAAASSPGYRLSAAVHLPGALQWNIPCTQDWEQIVSSTMSSQSWHQRYLNTVTVDTLACSK